MVGLVQDLASGRAPLVEVEVLVIPTSEEQDATVDATSEKAGEREEPMATSAAWCGLYGKLLMQVGVHILRWKKSVRRTHDAVFFLFS